MSTTDDAAFQRAQLDYDFAEPPMRRVAGQVSYTHETADDSPTMSLQFDIDYVMTDCIDIKRVVFVGGDVWFGDWGMKLDSYGHGDYRDERAVHWFLSQYQNRKWFQKEVDDAIKADAEGGK
jgi:hypothetical protein